MDQDNVAILDKGIAGQIESAKNSEFDKYVDQGIKKGLDLMKVRFGPGSDNPQIFHEVHHPEDAALRTEEIFSTIRGVVDPDKKDDKLYRQGRVAELVAAWHDVVQNWKPKEGTGKLPAIRINSRGDRRYKKEAVLWLLGITQKTA